MHGRKVILNLLQSFQPGILVISVLLPHIKFELMAFSASCVKWRVRAGDVKTRFHRYYSSSVRLTSGLGKHLPLMLRSTELNTFSMTNTIYRANGGIYQLSGKTPLQYDGKASCMSKQSVTLLHLFWRPAKTMNVFIIRFKSLWLEYITKPMNKHKFND